jgi:hypothetical protein
MNKNYLNYDWSPVINFESGGRLYYNRRLSKPTWPGGASGVTIGIGADLGYMTNQEYVKYFSKFFNQNDNSRLASVIGLKGQVAKNSLHKVSGVELNWENAISAFIDWTLPKFWRLTNGIWPGIQHLCIPAQVALVSIVFNRGTSLVGPSRVEMKNIQKLVLTKNYKGIAAEIRSMKRLWVGKNLDGLLKRRDSEAIMVDTCEF